MRVGIVGRFGNGSVLLNGQTIKTKNLEAGLKKYTTFDIREVDSFGCLKRPGQLVKDLKQTFKGCFAIIMLPAQNGILLFAPLLFFFKILYKKRIFYDVIGGWLPAYLTKRKWLSFILKKFDGIWVETSSMKSVLEIMGFTNVSVIPNFKDLKPLTKSELVYPTGIPYRFCTFSRVMKEKGIETAIEVIKEVNEQLGYTACALDVYGQIWEESKVWFEELQDEFPDYVQYKGAVEADKSVEVLQNYFALLFPTRFYTEGIPGTIIDAYAAGIPVISAKWESFADVVDDGKTGIGYEFDNREAFKNVLLNVAQNPKVILDMKPNCVEKAKNYLPETATDEITEKFRGGGMTSIR